MTILNAINWFEIPVRDIDRAIAFYSAMLNKPVGKGEFAGMPHGFLPSSEDGVGGALVQSDHLTPGGANGTLIYLNASFDLDGCLVRAQAAGATIVQEKTAIPPQGYMAIVMDTEGNRIALHQPPQPE